MAAEPSAPPASGGGAVIRLTLMGDRNRRRRIDRLVRELEGYEYAMRDRCAQLLELCDHGDDLHTEVRRVLEALEGQS